MKKIKPVVAWAVICEGKIHLWEVGRPYYEIYARKFDGQNAYEKIMRVRITPIHPRKKRRKRRGK